jgi:hypothetical protein
MKRILVGKIGRYFSPSFSCFATKCLCCYCQRALVSDSQMTWTQRGSTMDQKWSQCMGFPVWCHPINSNSSTGFSLWRPGFTPRLAHAGSVVDLSDTEKGFLWALQFSPISIIPVLPHIHSCIMWMSDSKPVSSHSSKQTVIPPHNNKHNYRYTYTCTCTHIYTGVYMHVCTRTHTERLEKN